MRRGLALLIVVGACGGSGGDSNVAPTAVLRVDNAIKQVGDPFELDGSSSSDPDGTVVQYRLLFGDGSPRVATGVAMTPHAFATPGVYMVQLVVVDDDGAESSPDVLTVTVTIEPPPGGCLSDDECRPGERCDTTSGNCVPADPCSAGGICDAPLVCEAGVCRCADGAQCGDACFDLANDPAHCGSCDRACSSGVECIGGVCQNPSCGPNETLCPDGACHNLNTDPNHCGDCTRACSDGQACVGGSCQMEMCPPGFDLCPDGACHDLSSDAENCGFCGNKCDLGECQMFTCTGDLCPPGFSLCPDGGCYDLTSDPFNCGGCFNFCESFDCEMSMCSLGEPGTVLETMPAPPFQTITGLARDAAGNWYFSTGRRFVWWDPPSGIEFADWFIQDESTRRANGLVFLETSGQLFTGAYDRFDPFSASDLEGYFILEETWSTQAPGEGGPCTTDGAIVYVFDNLTQELIQLDAMSLSELDRSDVGGLDFGDRFTDLALDGYGGIWAVRPNPMGPGAALMKKIDIDTMSVVLDISPPDSDGIGGVELVDGSLWGAGRNGVWRMVP